MLRLTLIPSLIVLALMAVPVAAQDAGGIKLTPEVLGIDDNQAQALAHTLSMLQRAGAASAAAQGQFGSGAGVVGRATNAAGSGNAANGAPPDRQSINQQMIARVRGDGGFLSGFNLGQPLSTSRVTPVATDVIGNAVPVVNETFSGPVSIVRGNGNVVQQQVSGSGGGATAQQQIVTTNGGTGAGASNVALGQSH